MSAAPKASSKKSSPDPASGHVALKTWNRLENTALGRWLFSRFVCYKAPYFGSIRPLIVALRPGYCEVKIAKRGAVLNHIGTVHAIAMCNMAELAAGVMTDISIPSTHRWIPKGMTVEYLRKAPTDVRAVARIEPMPEFGEAEDLIIPVEVFDTSQAVVFKAAITMWVTARKKRH